MKNCVVLLLCFASVCAAADKPQCEGAGTLPRVGPFLGNFRVFKNQWIVGGDPSAFLSSDNGATWRQVLPQPPSVTVGGRILGPFEIGAQDEALFAIPSGRKFVIESRDGVNWNIIPTPIEPIDFAATPNLWVMLGGSQSVDIRTSRDQGQTWVQAPALDPVFPPQLDNSWQLAMTNGRILLADDVDFGIVAGTPANQKRITRVRRLSLDAERWEDVTPCRCSFSFSSAMHSSSTDLEGVLAGFAQEADTHAVLGLLSTTDAGTTWSLRPEIPVGGLPLIFNDALVVAFDNLFAPRYLYSADAGVSWRSVGDGLPTYVPGSRDPTVLIGRTEDSLVFRGTAGAELFTCSLR